MLSPYIFAERNYDTTPPLNLSQVHTHEIYELYCFLRGRARYFVEGTVYTLNPGDVLLMKRAEAHCLIIDKLLPYERMYIHFSGNALIGEIAPQIIDFLDNRPLGKLNKYAAEKSTNLIPYLDIICKSENFQEKQLYLTFALHELQQVIPDENDTPTDSLQDIIGYINNNLFENISLDTIAEQFFISKNYLNLKFKKRTGSTIWSYIVTKRLIYSRELLLNGERPTRVYQKCGFNDYCSFYRAYKQKFGISPNEEIRAQNT